MATGYKLDTESIRLIDNVVRRVLASEPTTRGRQRRTGGGQSSSAEGVLGITLEDIPAAQVVEQPANSPDAPLSYYIFWGKVARVTLSIGESKGLVTQQEKGHDNWFNTCTAKVHKGRLVQGKKITINGTTIIVVDVEPCE
jgi:hypothetical protein